MQARRTSSASAVGEFFDHALDTCKVLPFTMTLFAPFDESDSRISPLCSLMLLIEMLTSYTLTFWEQYVTNILHIRWCFEGLYMAHVLHILAYFDGYNLVTAYVLGQWRVCSIVMFIFNVFCMSNILFSVYQIYQFNISRPLSEKHSVIYSIQPIVPTIELNVAALLWALFSPGQILFLDLPVFLFTVATVNANIISRLIISHMSNSRAQMCNTTVMLYCAAALMSMSNILSASEELFLLKLLAVFSFLAYVHHFYCVVREMSAKLQIEVFSLGYLKRRSTRKQG
ncbi:putative integral membrane protein [Acanthocheilonema viteae]